MNRGLILVTSLAVGVALGCIIWFFLPVNAALKSFVLLAALPATSFLLVYFWWAPNNLFFTFVPEGRAKVVVRGDAFKKALLQWEGHKLAMFSSQDHNAGDVIEGGLNLRKHFLGGLRFYGFWPIDDIYLYDFSWTNVLQDGTVQPHPKQTLDYCLVKKDVYWAKVWKAEDKKMLPLDVELVLTIRILNPYKALFRVQNWLETTINRIEPAVRNAISRKAYKTWIGGEADLADKIYKQEEVDDLLKEFRSDLGVDVRAIEVRSINPTTAEVDRAREATLKKYFAEQDRERITVEAEAERRRLNAVYGTIQEFGDLGKMIRLLEALEKSPGEGSKLILPIPGMADLISQVFPGKEPSSLSPEEIRNLRGFIEGLREQKSS